MKKMRWIISGLLLLSLLLNKRISAQRTQPRYMVKIYEDNDFFNIQGHGTDNSYTNGTRLDFFYTKEKRSGFFIDRIIPVVCPGPCAAISVRHISADNISLDSITNCSRGLRASDPALLC